MKLGFDLRDFKGGVHTIGYPNDLSFKLSTRGCKRTTKVLWISPPMVPLYVRFYGTSTPSAYDQHKDDTGNNEDLSFEEQHTEPRPDEANEAEEQLLNTMNIHGPALRKAYIILYLKEEE